LKAILIDPGKRAIHYVETLAELPDIYALIGCDSIDSCFPFGKGEVCYVDDIGALKQPALPYFLVPEFTWPIYGRALVLGFDRGGKERSTRLTVEEISETIIFPQKRQN
jgi:hypothetical protein